MIVSEHYLKYSDVWWDSRGNSAHGFWRVNIHYCKKQDLVAPHSKATEGMCVWVSVARRAPLSIPCRLHFPCKALVFSPCLLNELLLCGNWRSFCAANKELQGLSRLSSVPLSIFLPSFFFPCPPHYALVSYLLCNVLCKDSSKHLFSIFERGGVVASGFRRSLSIYWNRVPFLWCAISPFASIDKFLQFQLAEAQFHNPSWPNTGKSGRIRFELCSDPYPYLT